MTTLGPTFAMIKGEPINVLDYGADPTGSADSTTAIQTAFQKGTHIYFPKGTYKVTQVGQIILDATTADSASITGQDAIINASSITATTVGNVIQINGNTSLKLYIANIQINGNYQDTSVQATDATTGLRITVADELDIENITIQDFSFNNLTIATLDVYPTINPAIVSRGSIRNCKFYRAMYSNLNVYGNKYEISNIESTYAGRPGLGINYGGYGVNAQGFYITIKDSNFENNGRYNIDVRNAQNVLVDGNNCYAAGWYHVNAYNEIDVKAFSSGRFVNNTFDGAGVSAGGIKAGAVNSSSTVDVREVVVINNTFRNLYSTAEGYGVVISCDNTHRPLKVLINDNIFYSNSIAGKAIEISNNTTNTQIDYVEILGNYIKDSSYISSGGAYNVNIANNYIESNNVVYTTGIYVAPNFGLGLMAIVKNNILQTTNDSFFTNAVDVEAFVNQDVSDNYVNGREFGSPQSVTKVFSISGTGASTNFATIEGNGAVVGLKINWMASTGTSTSTTVETGECILSTTILGPSATPVLPSTSPYTIPQIATSKTVGTTYTLSTSFVATITGSTVVLSATATTNSGGTIVVNATISAILNVDGIITTL